MRGWYYDAYNYANTACTMDPNNAEYRAMQSRVRNNGSYNNPFTRAYNQNNAYGTNGAGCDMCDVCTMLMCLDCLCRH